MAIGNEQSDQGLHWLLFEPTHDKTNKMACNQSDQSSACICPVWSVFAVCIKKARVLSYLLHSNDSDQTGGDTQADLSLCWTHRSFCWFCHEATHFICIVSMHYCMVKPNCSNLRRTTAKLLGVLIFRNFTVCSACTVFICMHLLFFFFTSKLKNQWNFIKLIFKLKGQTLLSC